MNRKNGMSHEKKRRYLFVFGMLILPLTQFAIFYVCLNFNSVLMAFQVGRKMDWSSGFPMYTDEILYGWGNFRAIITDQNGILSESLVNTLKYFALNLLILLPGSLFISFFLFKRILGYKFFRIVFFLPSIISAIIYVTGFTETIGMYGPIYEIIEKTGGKWRNWLIYPETATNTILFYSFWTGFGINMLLFQSAMSRIPAEILESGCIDGAGWIREMFVLAMPMIWPTISMTVLLAFTGIFTGGSIVLLFVTQGGESASISTISYWIFNKTQKESSGLLGDAAAAGLFFTVISMPLILAVRWLLNKIDPGVEY